jgi:hypothetical protein
MTSQARQTILSNQTAINIGAAMAILVMCVGLTYRYAQMENRIALCELRLDRIDANRWSVEHAARAFTELKRLNPALVTPDPYQIKKELQP